MTTQKSVFMRFPPPPVNPRYAGDFGARDRGNVAKAIGPGAGFPAPARCPSPPARVLLMAQQRAVFPRDWGLQTRMLFTLFTLGLLYVGFVAVLLSVGASAITILVVV